MFVLWATWFEQASEYGMYVLLDMHQDEALVNDFACLRVLRQASCVLPADKGELSDHTGRAL